MNKKFEIYKASELFKEFLCTFDENGILLFEEEIFDNCENLNNSEKRELSEGTESEIDLYCYETLGESESEDILDDRT